MPLVQRNPASWHDGAMPIQPELAAEARERLAILEHMGTDARLTGAWAGQPAHGTENLELDDAHSQAAGRFYSERVNLREADIQPLRNEYGEQIAWLEQSTGGLVYQATVEHSIMGDLLDLFLVPAAPEEWEAQKEALREGKARAFVVALDMPHDTGWWDIEFEVVDAALIRVG